MSATWALGHRFPDPIDLRRLRVAVLGGSSPFTMVLFDAIAESSLPLSQVVLHGRRAEALEAVARYGTRRLSSVGGKVRATQDLAEALEGAHVVIHQIRYGGMQGRMEDEAVAQSLGCLSDESLGIGGMNAALRTAPGVRATASVIRSFAPDAVVLNLTNPMGLCTAVLTASRLTAIGLCELPLTTLEEACSVLGVRAEEVQWEFAGFSHRGFVYRVDHEGEALLPSLPTRLGPRTIGGIRSGEIKALNALPLSYFALYLGRAVVKPGRAAFLTNLRERILKEASLRPNQRPPSLVARSTPWYRKSVVPFIAALCSTKPSVHVADLSTSDGLIREGRATVSATGVVPCPVGPPPQPVADWLHHFEEQERLAFEAAVDPSFERITAALAVDPLIPSAKVEEGARLLWSRLGRARPDQGAGNSASSVQ